MPTRPVCVRVKISSKQYVKSARDYFIRETSASPSRRFPILPVLRKAGATGTFPQTCYENVRVPFSWVTRPAGTQGTYMNERIRNGTTYIYTIVNVLDA